MEQLGLSVSFKPDDTDALLDGLSGSFKASFPSGSFAGESFNLQEVLAAKDTLSLFSGDVTFSVPDDSVRSEEGVRLSSDGYVTTVPIPGSLPLLVGGIGFIGGIVAKRRLSRQPGKDAGPIPSPV